MPAGLPTVTAARPCKHWWHSRTLIVNAVLLALLAAESQLNILQPLLPVNVYGVIAFALPVINAALRVLTTTSLTLGGGARDDAGEAP